MTPQQALAFIREHGIVLASAKGPVPNLVDAIAGERIRGSWWGHERGQEIFRILERVRGSRDVLTCRLVDRRVTFVHRRLWPALARVANRFPASSLAQVIEEHSSLGRHRTRYVAFAQWLPTGIALRARRLTEAEALEALGGQGTWVRRRR
ncbi:MAG: hypothetical protein JSR73_09055 [Proteobacteria bacterium]|nr:hypothetical protein [Pseudomonadota bacterium]